MAQQTASDPVPALGSLDDRILSTLQGLHGRVAFNGLRRKLGAHPESLARALRRLEREGLVEHADGGYRSLSDGAVEAAALPSDLRPIARIELPHDLDETIVFHRMAGRWFGSLRWVGIIEQPGRRLLAWARRDGHGQVLLGVHRGVLRVYVPESGGSDDPAETEALAYELLVQAVDAVQPLTGPGGTAYFLLGRARSPSISRNN
jgi:DNA-binding Lrp family transcriptional regulator